MIKLDLPQPDTRSVEHSAQLVELIRNTIAANSGWIDFSHYMQLALYAPGLGYYTAGRQKFGESGDFITAPELSPLFAWSLANPVAKILQAMPGSQIIEFGAGSGKLAADMLMRLEELAVLPDKYLIVELSAELKARQSYTIMQQVPHLHDRVVWLHQLPGTELNAVVLANELLDAMPVTRFVKNSSRFYPLGVAMQDNSLVLQAGKFEQSLHDKLTAIEREAGLELCDGYTSEINLLIDPWIQSVAEFLHQGAIYLIDYGYPRREYYLPERSMGTLTCYFQHRGLDDALRYPGLQDITAFVDFTAVAEAAMRSELSLQGFTSMASFLLDCGLPELLQGQLGDNERSNILWIQQMKSLTLPSEMGERFKVMALNKNLELNLPGFGMQDMRYRL